MQRHAPVNPNLHLGVAHTKYAKVVLLDRLSQRSISPHSHGCLCQSVGRPSGYRVSDSVVNIIAYLVPRVENHLFVGMVRVQCGDDAFHWIVELDGTHAHSYTELETVAFLRVVWLKKGSNCRTGLPLLLKTVQPLLIQHGLTKMG